MSPSLVARFWKYVPNSSGPNSCWEWVGSRAVRGGYGQINERGKLLKAHRISYELRYGKIPRGKMVLHACDNPPCVNPEHLYAGTARQNSWDAWRRGRAVLPANAPKGAKHHDAKLTPAKVRLIRQGKDSCGILARRFSVTKQTVWKARRRLTWKEVK